MPHHFVLEHLPHGLLYLLEEDLRDATTQGVHRVQELGLDRVEQRLEHVVFEGKLQEQNHGRVSVGIPVAFQVDGLLNGTYHELNGVK